MSQESADAEKIDLRNELEVLNRKLADAHKLAALGRLSAGIVHEINSPIGSIFSNNEVILRALDKLKQMLSDAQTQKIAPPQKAVDIVAMIAALTEVDKIACERIAGVVRSLKTFARVNEGDLRKVSVNELIQNTIKLTSTMYKRHITFVSDFAELPEVECFPGLLNQVFLNVIVNAAQAIPEEGTITTRTRQDGRFVEIAIEDNGEGIPAELRPKIFAAGFTTKPLGEGTGIGLTISREIVEDTHGGKISFETAVGKGTIFHIRIPIEQPRNAKDGAEAMNRSTT